jgi:hypothetical protein
MRLVLIALFGAMIVVAAWAWVAAPSTARFSVRWGSPPALDGTVGKATALVMWLGLGAIALVGSLLAQEDGAGIAVAGAGLLAFLLVMEIASVRRAMR